MPKSISHSPPVLHRSRLVVAALALVSLYLGLIFDTGAPSVITQESSVQSPSPRDSSKLLRVPYISQGPTKWCFQTALSMVLQYNGKHVLPADIAKANNQRPNRATSILDVLFGWVSSYVGRWPELSLHRSLSDWGFQQFQRVLNDGGGEPIIVSTFGIPGHTLVVVGYAVEDGKDYLYLHDPSGYLTEHKWNTGFLAYAKVSWDLFSRSYWTKVFISHPQIQAPSRASTQMSLSRYYLAAFLRRSPLTMPLEAERHDDACHPATSPAEMPAPLPQRI